MSIKLLHGDCREVLKTLPGASVHCCVTSPPYYGLRSYLDADHPDKHREIGSESSPEAYLATMVAVFREVRRVLRPDGVCWVNVGDSFASGSKGSGGVSHSSAFHATAETGRSAGGVVPGQRFDAPKFDNGGLAAKQLMMMPARLAIALQADGWWLRSDIIWAKPNPMPESCRDRPTSAHEHVFMLTKSARYFFDADAVREVDVAGHPSGNGYARVDTKNIGCRLSYGGRGQEEQWQPGGGRNIRNVWTIATEAFPDAHFATMPTALVARCVKAGCPPGGTVLDPFAGVFTVPMVADRLQRDAIGIELSEAYCAIARSRMAADAGMFIDLDEQGSEPCRREESRDQSTAPIESAGPPRNGSQLSLFPNLTAAAIFGLAQLAPTAMAK
jgi:DNA modification methylase